MASVSLKSLIGKLNDNCRQTLEAAAGLCLSRTHYNVELEHWLTKLIERPDSDIAAIFKFFGVDSARVSADLTRCLDRLKTGNARPPALSPHTVEMAQQAWVIASIDFNAAKTRSGHLLLALLVDEDLSRQAREMSRELQKISPEALRKDLQVVIADTAEAGTEMGTPLGTGAPGGGPDSGGAPRPGGPSKTPSLDQYTIDLTERARQGKIDPVIGRDAEIRQVIDILTRRRQNNPIMTGEAGVGKTAVVEGFALRIAAGDVPPALRNVALRTLDLGLLQAGAGVKGEFENRLRSVIDEVQKSPHPIILFIDEAHTLIGAGGQAGQGDAANLLKPALARGQLRTIAATTWAEYKKYFERDAALARRFQVVKVEEPDDDKAIAMMRGLTDSLRTHFGVEVLDDAVSESVRMSKRYIAGRQLPDKSVSVLDTACARVATGLNATPAEVEDCQRSIDHLSVAIEALERELATGAQHDERLEKMHAQKAAFEQEYAELTTRWEKEKELVEQIRTMRSRLAGTEKPKEGEKIEPLTEEARVKLLGELEQTMNVLKGVQGESPLLQPYVDGQTIAQVVAAWTGIPVGRIVTDEIRGILNLQKEMEERVVGQSHAIDSISQRIRISRANLADPRKPIGVFFLVGPSGVGKTETAITLAELVYGGTQNMTVINMSEFKEEHKVSMLMGSPPGYVGYGEGGVLTEAVRRRPYSVVLLDEMEKAHPGVQDIFYQVFDKGMLRDGEGRDIDFKNTLILMTSNAATDTMAKLCADPDTMPSPDALREAIHPELLKTFKPAFLGRVTVVPYFPLSDAIMRQIAELQLRRVADRVRQNYSASFTYDSSVLDHIVSRCTEVESGARNVDRILSGTMLPELAAEFLSRLADGKPIKQVRVSMTADERFSYHIDG